MPINRNQMTPLSQGGTRTAHAGKGSAQAPAGGARGGLPTFGQNFSKPMAPPAVAPQAPPSGMGMMQAPMGVSGRPT
jgi:hypothetical protein